MQHHHCYLGKLNVDFLHISYILLPDELDKPDEEYGTKMAKLLALKAIKSMGVSTWVVVHAAEETKSPVIIETAEVLLPYAGLEELAYFLIPMAKKVIGES